MATHSDEVTQTQDPERIIPDYSSLSLAERAGLDLYVPEGNVVRLSHLSTLFLPLFSHVYSTNRLSVL